MIKQLQELARGRWHYDLAFSCTLGVLAVAIPTRRSKQCHTYKPQRFVTTSGLRISIISKSTMYLGCIDEAHAEGS